jgi:hypothetical protein
MLCAVRSGAYHILHFTPACRDNRRANPDTPHNQRTTGPAKPNAGTSRQGKTGWKSRRANTQRSCHLTHNRRTQETCDGPAPQRWRAMALAALTARQRRRLPCGLLSSTRDGCMVYGSMGPWVHGCNVCNACMRVFVHAFMRACVHVCMGAWYDKEQSCQAAYFFCFLAFCSAFTSGFLPKAVNARAGHVRLRADWPQD